MAEYNDDFYEDQWKESYAAAREVLPLVFDVFTPKSVLDVGCGVGSWLKAASDLGVQEIRGVDGDYVPRDKLLIPPDHFVPHNLEEIFRLDRSFDLAISLEVAEHITPANAHDFVSNITRHANIVLFSAAIPFQGGTGHINENWLEYWALAFKEFGYLPVDIVRPQVWNNPRVPFWYRQNIIVFLKEDLFAHYGLTPPAGPQMLSVVHPDMLIWMFARDKENSGEILQSLKGYRDMLTALDSFDRHKVEPPAEHLDTYEVSFEKTTGLSALFNFLRKPKGKK